VADGAAKQAAWALSGMENPPNWSLGEVMTVSPKVRISGIVENYFELISLS
jgi:xylulokinase